jgi:hypothetical protein
LLAHGNPQEQRERGLHLPSDLEWATLGKTLLLMGKILFMGNVANGQVLDGQDFANGQFR